MKLKTGKGTYDRDDYRHFDGLETAYIEHEKMNFVLNKVQPRLIEQLREEDRDKGMPRGFPKYIAVTDKEIFLHPPPDKNYKMHLEVLISARI